MSLLRDALRTRLWVIPAIASAAAFVAAEGLVALDRALGPNAASAVMFGGGADSARSILSTIATAMLSFTGLVFTVTMLVLQLASSQLSPRVTRTFLRDRLNQTVLGLFVATFVYALLVLREVRAEVPGPAFVPGLAIWWAFALLLGSIAAFVAYIDHMARSIQASSVIGAVATETRAAIERLYPEDVGAEPEPGSGPRPPETTGPDAPPPPERVPDRIIRAGETSGVVLAVDDGRLLERAIRAGVVLRLVPWVGDHVVAGSTLLVVYGQEADDGEDLDELRSAISLGRERTMEQDAAFGFRQLVDVADRALSPGVNDPTTAIQVLDELHDLLRRILRRRLPSSERLDDDGNLRLILPRPGWSDYLDLALDEPRLYGAGSLPVARRITALLDDLEGAASAERIGPIRRHRALLDAAIERAFPAEHDRTVARRPGRRGPPAT